MPASMLRHWVLITVFCPSLTCSTLRHLCSGVCEGLHGAGLEAADLHRRRRHHRLLCGLPWGHWWRSREVAWGQHQGGQREGLQGGYKRGEPSIWVWIWAATVMGELIRRVFVFRCPTCRKTRSISFKCGPPTWPVSASPQCPVKPSCVRNGPLLCQVGDTNAA